MCVQICLILALWDAMESPFRCLDEFDIFMVRVDCAWSLIKIMILMIIIIITIIIIMIIIIMIMKMIIIIIIILKIIFISLG